jgi:hypothetical protein
MEISQNVQLPALLLQIVYNPAHCFRKFKWFKSYMPLQVRQTHYRNLFIVNLMHQAVKPWIWEMTILVYFEGTLFLKSLEQVP